MSKTIAGVSTNVIQPRVASLVSAPSPMGLSNPPIHTAMLHGTSDTQPIEVWHKCLGHLNLDAILQLTKMSTGINIGPAKDLTLNLSCNGCLKSSQHKQISRITRVPPANKLSCVHIDIKGPCLGKDVYGFRYYMVCIDEKTRYCKTYCMVDRKDAFGYFKNYHVESERETNTLLVEIQLDAGPELVSNDFRAYLTNKGIKLRLMAPYTPQMNGIAERNIRTITEHASAMLWTAHLPIGFWAAAVTMATFLRNRSPTKVLDVTPFEAWYGYRPNLGWLRTFGCRAQVAIPAEIRSKTDWDAKSGDCILIGYFDTENLYELWDVIRGTVIRSRDVIFWEDILGHENLIQYELTNGSLIVPHIARPYAEQHSISIPDVPPEHSDIPLKPLNQGRHVPTLQKEIPENPGLVWIPYQPPGPQPS